MGRRHDEEDGAYDLQLHAATPRHKPPPRTAPTAVWREQYAALCRQRFLLSARNWRTTAAQLLMGLVVCMLLLSFQFLSDSVLSSEILHQPATPIGPIPRCVPGAHSVRANADGSLSPGCNTVLFAPATERVVTLLRRVAENSGLAYDYDFVPLPGGADVGDVRLVNASTSSSAACDVGRCDVEPDFPECLPCAVVRDNATLTQYLLAHPNSTQTGLWLFGAYATGAPDVSYAILYNYTVTVAPFNRPSRALELQRGLQQAQERWLWS